MAAASEKANFSHAQAANPTNAMPAGLDNNEGDYAREKQLDDRDSSASRGEEDPILTQFSEREQRRIVHKIDRRLIPICGIMYCVSLLDRTNLGNARIAGMDVTLNLRAPGPDRYSIITLVFFITYVLFQPPATVLTRKIGPRVFLSTITLLWGAVMIGFGFVDDWTQLLGLRLVLGVFEAGFFPGCVYLLSTWYSRYDMGKRYACFYIIGACASALGGILAYGLMQMGGLQGLEGWRWIFIIEGVVTCAVACLGYLFLLSFPDNSSSKSLRFLSTDELRYVIARVEKDRADSQLEAFSLKKFLSPALDWQIWSFAFIFGSVTTVTYALAFFMPVILYEQMGFSLALAQCLVAPPYAFAGIVLFVTAWISDRYHQRGILLCINALICIIGLPLIGWGPNSAVQYFGVFLATAGANANIPLALTYQANNIRGQWKRAFCSATLVGMGGVGGIIGSTVYRQVDHPTYYPGLSVSMGANVLIMVLVGILTLHYKKQNRRADRGEIIIANTPGFRYTF